MESEFWKPENLRFAVIFTAVLYWLGIYIFLLPAYFERLRHPRSVALPRVGLPRRTNLYTLIYIFSPLIFLFVLAGIVLWGMVSIFSVIMLMVMSPFHWLFSMLPFDEHFSLIKPWKRMGGRMFEYSRKMFLFLAGEQPMQEMKPIQEDKDKT
jgi:hypothetical protein